MCNVAHANSVLLLDVGHEGALVVDLEVKNAMLVGQGECGAVDGSRVADTEGLEVQTVERGEHGEFELECVGGGESIWHPCVPGIFRDRDAVGLNDC